nr:5595_t:CDS:10 [Entrophospora candida]
MEDLNRGIKHLQVKPKGKRKLENELDLPSEEKYISKDQANKVDRALYEIFENTNEKKILQGVHLLVIGGPTGTSKTSTIKYVCKKRNYHIVDWTEFQNSEEFESVFDGLSTFFTYFSRRIENQALKNGCTKQILLFDDLSAFTHNHSNKIFNEVIEVYLDSKTVKFPIVFIITDVRINDTGNDYTGKQDKFKDINMRTFFTPNILRSEKSKCIEFPAVPKYLMIDALQKYANNEYRNDQQKRLASLQLIHLVEKRSNGDLRGAINLLESFLIQIPKEVKEEIIAASMTNVLSRSPKKLKTYNTNNVNASPTSPNNFASSSKFTVNVNYEIEQLVDTTLNTLSRDNLTNKYTAVRNVLYNFRAEPNVFGGDETSIKLGRLMGKEVAPDEMPDRHPIQIMPEVFLDNLDTDSDFYLDLLQNNYINSFGNISELAFAAERLSRSDCLTRNGEIMNSETLKSCAVLYATRSLYFAHIQKVPFNRSFSGFKRSPYFDTFGIQRQKHMEYQEILNATYKKEHRVKNDQIWQLEYVPYLKHIVKKKDIASKYNSLQKKLIDELTFYQKH